MIYGFVQHIKGFSIYLKYDGKIFKGNDGVSFITENAGYAENGLKDNKN